jgi:hypothetical protein
LSERWPFHLALTRALREAGWPSRVVLTRNRVSLVSVRPMVALRGATPAALEVRVSDRLETTGEVGVRAVVDFVARRPGAADRLKALFTDLPRPVRASSAGERARTGGGRGRWHDLEVLEQAERAQHFPHLGPLPVVWGRADAAETRTSLRLGCYDAGARIIRIHRRLDHPQVPAWFVGFVIYHEYLHHELGVEQRDRGGRRQLHTPEFRRRERKHPHHAQAMAWEKAYLRAMLSASWMDQADAEVLRGSRLP